MRAVHLQIHCELSNTKDYTKDRERQSLLTGFLLGYKMSEYQGFLLGTTCGNLI